jgi:aryl-alcohol dehydrogenase-like predicted oxidoreductase
MQTKPFGSTGLSVSPIGIGLAALGRPGYITIGHADALGRNYDVTAMEAGAHRVLDKAYAMGVRYFDAARSYGRAEAFLASWLQRRGIPPGDVVVGSKWGYTYTAGWQVEAAAHEVKEHSLAVLQRQWKESQAHLGAHLDPLPDSFRHTGKRCLGKPGSVEGAGAAERVAEPLSASA